MVYDKVKFLCDEQGKSISRVEREAGLTNATISKWAKASPRLENIAAVAKVLGVSVEYFVEEE